MKNNFPLLTFLAVLTLGSAATDASELKEYTVTVGDDTVVGGASFVKVKLPEEKVGAYRKSAILFSTYLMNCKDSKGVMKNPFLGRDISYTISDSNAGCLLDLDVYGSSSYTCRMLPADRKALASGVKERALTDDLMSDFSIVEKKVLFDSSICDYYRH